MFCEGVLCIRQNKLPGVAADLSFVLFFVVDGVATMKTIVDTTMTRRHDKTQRRDDVVVDAHVHFHHCTILQVCYLRSV